MNIEFLVDSLFLSVLWRCPLTVFWVPFVFDEGQLLILSGVPFFFLLSRFRPPRPPAYDVSTYEFFQIIFLRGHYAFWIYRYSTFIEFTKVLAIISSIILSFFPLSCFWDSHCAYVGMLCSFYFYFLSSPDWIYI